MDDILNKLWACNACENPLVRETKPKFRAVYGRGFLFHSAFNFTLGEPREMAMTTGLHTIRDVYCGQCNQYVGWRYEKAEHESETYKLGKFLMEAERLKGVTGAISKLQARL